MSTSGRRQRRGEAQRRIGVGRVKTQRGINELLDRGFIRVLEPGGFQRKSHHATVYALTNEPLEDRDGAVAPKDFMRWCEKSSVSMTDTVSLTQTPQESLTVSMTNTVDPLKLPLTVSMTDTQIVVTKGASCGRPSSATGKRSGGSSSRRSMALQWSGQRHDVLVRWDHDERPGQV